MPDILQLQRQRTEKIAQLRAIIVKVDEEKRGLTDEEIQNFNGLDTEIKAINESIEKEDRVAELEKIIEKDTKDPPTSDPGKDETEFRNLGEFFYAIAESKEGRINPKLSDYRAKESRARQQMGIGQLGGYAIPDQFLKEIKSVDPQAAVVRPRATVIPAGNPPDAKIRIPALDQSTAQNMYGGVVVQHTGENVSLNETNLNLRRITLEPHKIAGYTALTNELMLNWDAAGTFLQTQLKLAVLGAEDMDFYSGNGANRATGFINSACRIDYSRATASTCVFADVIGMFARAKLGGSLIWVASQTLIPQLAEIRDTGNNNLWIQNAAAGIPSSMFGFPVIFNERSVALGTRGDLALVDLKYYLIKDGSGPRVDVSTDVLFQSDDTAFRIVWYVDGTPWLNTPIPLEGSTTNTISPFVILN